MSSSPAPASAGPSAAVHPPSEPEAGSAATRGTSSWLPELSLLGVAFIWGINIPLMKNGLDQMHVYSFNAVRLTLSALILGLLGWQEYRASSRRPQALPIHKILVYSLIVSVIYQLLFLLGISRATSGNTGLILSTIPMWTALAARVILQERLRPLAWFGLLVAFAGTLIVTLQKQHPAARDVSLFGNLFTLGAALSWSFGTIYSRPLMKHISPVQLSACSAVLGLPVHLAIACAVPGGSLAALPQPVVWMTVLYSGVFSTGLALPMWNFGVRHAGAAQAAAFQNLIPVIAILTAWLFRGEAITLPQLTGGGMIICGLFIMRRGRG